MIDQFFYNILEAYQILFGITSFFFVIDLGFYYITSRTQYLDKYLISPNKNNNHLDENYPVILFNMGVMFVMFLSCFYRLTITSPLVFFRNPPPLWMLSAETFTMLMIDDFYNYWFHRLLHTKFFYKKFHYLHHQSRFPNILDFIYSHPLEPFIGSFALLACYLVFQPHLFSIITSIVIRYLHENEIHSGYDFPFSLTRYIPIMSSSRHHSIHHLKTVGNYGNTFIIWDKLFGTEIN